MPTTRAGSKRLLRDLNRSIVLNLIAARAPISRTDLAREGRLPAATVTHIVSDFVHAGLVTETPSDESRGGRRPVHLAINPSAGHVVGVKLREDGMTVAVCDLACNVVRHIEAPLTAGVAPFQAVDGIAQAVEACIAQAGIARSSVLRVGVGLSGLIDSTRGICRYSAILDWRNFELGPALEYQLRLPVRIDNDVNTLAVAERHFGAGRQADDFLLVTIGRGVGLGIVVGGEIYRGAHGWAGEVGHMTIDRSESAPPCNCGKRGCLEAVASDYGILRAATGADPGHHVEEAMSTLTARARAGDERIRAIFAQAGAALGVALANLANIFDPAMVLLGGEGMRAGDLLLDALRATLPSHIFGSHTRPGAAREPSIMTLTTTDVEWARGAASHVLSDLFRVPIRHSDEPLPIDELLTRLVSTGRHRPSKARRQPAAMAL
jgi:predicted NBD/HSP70 family sugar kinase